ncbi:proteasome accessory factor PafA2 family protein [Nostoc sp. DedQUE07]|uniref:proteasome accessory factor PafA2 family protein n=1 Tax=Nostoc sp. DedQUE07 TaxID=3075392 RepID=UPI003919E2AC
MRERVFSLETEYAIAFQTQGGNQSPNEELIVKALCQKLEERCGIPGSQFLVNGSKFYYDVGHAEWSLPECRSAYEAVVYDKAADYTLSSIIPDAEQVLINQGFQGQLLLIKNNVDASGNTYGCHENYLAQRQTQWLGSEDYLWLTKRYLIPFLVTRQVFCGAGRVGFGQKLEEGIGFQLMQRADFIEELVSSETRKQRAILSLAREHEPLAKGNYRRLHLILADTNMSGWATYLKLGTTGIILRMLEDMDFREIPHLLDPIQTLRQISRDPSCTVEVSLQDGRQLTAIEIQRIYLEQAKRYFGEHPISADEQRIMQIWEDVLNQLTTDPMQLVGKLDWVTKKSFMERYLQSVGMQWKEVLQGSEVYYKLLQLDIFYHDLFIENSLFYRLLKDKPDTLVTAKEVLTAQSSPPPYTRAWVRGTAIAASRDMGLNVEVDRWDDLKVNNRKVVLPDPLKFFSPELYVILSNSTALETVTERSRYNIVIFSSDHNIGQNIANQLVGLGYKQARLQDKPNPEFNIKWNNASNWMIDEIGDIICRELELDDVQICRRYGEGRNDCIDINLGGLVAPSLPILQRDRYSITIISSNLEMGESLADELGSINYRTDIVLPEGTSGFSIKWGSATEAVIDEIVSILCRKFALSNAQIKRLHKLNLEDDRIFISLYTLPKSFFQRVINFGKRIIIDSNNS